MERETPPPDIAKEFVDDWDKKSAPVGEQPPSPQPQPQPDPAPPQPRPPAVSVLPADWNEGAPPALGEDPPAPAPVTPPAPGQPPPPESQNAQRMRLAIEERDRTIAELRRGLEQTETMKLRIEALSTERESLNEELERLRERVGQVDLREHPMFRQKYIEPQIKALQTAVNIGARFRLTGEQVKALFDMPLEEASVWLDRNAPAAREAIMRYRLDKETALDEAQRAMQNHSQEIQHLEQQRIEQQEAQRKLAVSTLQRTISAEARELTGMGSVLFTPIDEENADAPEITAALRRAGAVIQSTNSREKIRLMLKGSVAERMERIYAQMAAEIEALRADLARLSGVRPRIGRPGLPPSTRPMPPAPPAPPANPDDPAEDWNKAYDDKLANPGP